MANKKDFIVKGGIVVNEKTKIGADDDGNIEFKSFGTGVEELRNIMIREMMFNDAFGNEKKFAIDNATGRLKSMDVSRDVNDKISATVEDPLFLGANNSNDLPEGDNNLYYTDARARNALSASGSINYNSTTGRFTFTMPDTDDIDEGSTNLYYTDARADARVDAGFSAKSTADLSEGANLYYTDARADARIALQVGTNLDLSNQDTDDLTEGSNLYYTDARVSSKLAAGVGNIVTSGYIRGPATLTIDPAAHGDNTGKVVIAGDLQVDGTTTTINSTTVSIDDLNIVLAENASNASEANGAGITINGADATITYNSADDNFDFNKGIDVAGGLNATSDIFIGTTDVDHGHTDGDDGIRLSSGGSAMFTRNSSYATLYVNKLNNSGSWADFHKDGTKMGIIGVTSNTQDIYFTAPQAGSGIYLNGNGLLPATGAGATNHNAIDLGQTGVRWRNLYLSGGAYLGGNIDIANVGSDRKIQFQRTGGKTISIEHDYSQIYFYNVTDAEPMLTIGNDRGLTAYGTITSPDDIHVNYGNGNNGYLFLNKGASTDGGILFRTDNILKWQNVQGATSINWYSYAVTDVVMSLTQEGNLDLRGGQIGKNISDSFTLNGKTQPHYGLNLDPGASGVPIGISGYYGISLATDGNERVKVERDGTFNVYQNFNFHNSQGSSMPGHYYHNAYSNGNVYIHLYPQADFSGDTYFRFRQPNDGFTALWHDYSSNYLKYDSIFEAAHIKSVGSLNVGGASESGFDGTSGIAIGGDNPAISFASSASGRNQYLLYSTGNGPVDGGSLRLYEADANVDVWQVGGKASTNEYTMIMGGAASSYSTSDRTTFVLGGAPGTSMLEFRNQNAFRGYIFSTGSTIEHWSTGKIDLVPNGTANYRVTIEGGSLTAPNLRTHGSTYKGNFGAASFSWGGSGNYPTLYSSHQDRWIMLCAPHIPYLKSGVRGYAGTTSGATVLHEKENGGYWAAGAHPDAPNNWSIRDGQGGTYFSIDADAVVTLNGRSADWGQRVQGSSKGSLHIKPGTSSDNFGGAITWGSSDNSAGNEADAGIYVRSDGNYGTRMYISTTDSYSQGAKTAIEINDSGQVIIPRNYLMINTELRFPVSSESNWSNYIRSYGFPSQGYNASTAKYWIEYGAQGGHHFVVNTDGGVGAGENAYDDFTIWQGEVDGDRLVSVSNIGNTFIKGNLEVGGSTETGRNTTIGVRTNSSAFNINQTGLSLDFTAEVRAAGAAPSLGFHYEGLASRWLYIDSSGNFNFRSPVGENASNVYIQGTIIEESSIRHKENVSTITGSLDKVNSLRGVYYNRIDTPEQEEVGLIAEEVAEVVPELVMFSEDNTAEGVKYSKTVALLVEAIKELTARVEELESGKN